METASVEVAFGEWDTVDAVGSLDGEPIDVFEMEGTIKVAVEQQGAFGAVGQEALLDVAQEIAFEIGMFAKDGEGGSHLSGNLVAHPLDHRDGD